MSTAPLRSVYAPGNAASGDRTARLRADLDAALTAGDQLDLVYQPRVDLHSNRPVGAEALARWRHPEFGPVSPAEFIPLAEQAGLMPRLTAWVIERALRDHAPLNSVHPGFELSINVSSTNLREPDFVDRLADALARSGVEPRSIELEFTEDQLIPDDDELKARLARLAAMGVGLSIDDFGAGHSNLSYLRDFPADTLKIDRQFIRDLVANARDQIIVRSILSLAHALDFHVVAEGVEDPQALALLASWDCDEAQGYYICKPSPLRVIETWLRARNSPRA